jgi:hypothetical protein
MARIKIGDLLVKAGLIDDMQLQAALAHQRQWGGKLGDALVANGFLDEMMLWRGLSKQLAVPLVSLPEHAFAPGIEKVVPVELCRKHSIVPLSRDNREVTIATSEPNNIAGIDEVAFRVGARLKVVLAPDREVEWATRRLYTGEVAPCPPPRLRRVLAETEPDASLQVPQARGQMIDFTARGPSTPLHEVQGVARAAPVPAPAAAVPAPFAAAPTAWTSPAMPGVGAPGGGAPGFGAAGFGAPGFGAPGGGAAGFGTAGVGAAGPGPASGLGAPSMTAPAFGVAGFGGAPTGIPAGMAAAGVPTANPFASAPPSPAGYPPGAAAMGAVAASTAGQTEAALRETAALLRWIVEACIARGVFTRDEYVARVRAQQ